MPPRAAWFKHPFLRFVIAGTANTLATLALYMVLLAWVTPVVAWAIAFAAGIVFVNVVYPRFVFRVRPTAVGVAGNTLYYVASFLLGEMLLSAAIHWMALAPRVAGVVVAVAMVPLNFVVSRYLFSRPARAGLPPPATGTDPSRKSRGTRSRL